MAKSPPLPPSNPGSEHGRRQANGVRKKQGRPRTWNHLLQRKMIWLYLFSDMTNTKMIEHLEETAKVRTMQAYRKELLPNADDSWRPRDRSHMQQRVARLQKCVQDTLGMYNGITHPECQNPNMAITGDDGGEACPGSQEKSLPDPVIRRITIRSSRSSQNAQNLNDPIVVIVIQYTRGQKQKHRCLYSELFSILAKHLGQETGGFASGRTSGMSVYIHSIALAKTEVEGSHSLSLDLKDFAERLAINACGLRIPQGLRLHEFSKLRHLSLRRNRLTDLHQLPQSLEIVDISQNAFRVLPSILRQMKNLKILHIAHNSIRCLPSWLDEMTSLRIIFLDDNPFDIHTHGLIDFARTFCRYGCTQDPSSYCKSRFTSLLQRQLRQEKKQDAAVLVTSPQCICVRPEQQPSPCSSVPTTLPNVFEPSKWMNLFCDLNIISGSSRSSRSVMTFDSLMSARESVASLRPGMSWPELMLVHCCSRKDLSKGQDCLHRTLIGWQSGGVTTRPPPAGLLGGQDLGNNTALHFAAILELPVAAIILLIEHGCDPLRTNTRGETFLHLVHPRFWQGLKGHLVQLVQLLRGRRFPFGQRDHHGNTIFHHTAIVDNDLSIFLAEYLWLSRLYRNSSVQLPWQPHDLLCHDKLSTDVWLFACHERSQSPLRHNTAVVVPRLWAENQTDQDKFIVCKCCDQWSSSLHQFALALFRDYRQFGMYSRALDFGDPSELLKLLLSYNTDVNAYDSAGRTVLMAIIRGLCHRWPQHREGGTNLAYVQRCVNMLLAAGADIHRRDRRGNTALHYAVNYCAPGIVRKLITAGAPVNACNGRGVSVLRLLRESQTQHGWPLQVSAHFAQCLTVLLDHDAQLEPPSQWQWMSATAIGG